MKEGDVMGENTKKVTLKDDIPGFCIVPLPTENEMHEFVLYDSEENKISDGFFSSEKVANEKAREWLDNDVSFVVIDSDIEWYIQKATLIRDEIKRQRKSFKKSGILIDMSTYRNWQGDEIVYFMYNEVKYLFKGMYTGECYIKKVKE